MRESDGILLFPHRKVLVDLAKKHNITVTGTYMITGDYMETNADTLHRIVEDSFETTRSEL